MALAQNEHDVACPRSLDRCFDGPPTMMLRTAPRPPASAPRRTTDAIVSGSSDRGLSVVTIVTSDLAAAAAPIASLFFGSRSPAAPTTAIRRPLANAAAASSTDAIASGVWA